LQEIEDSQESSEDSSDNEYNIKDIKVDKKVLTKLVVLKTLQKIREMEEESEDSDKEIDRLENIRRKYRNKFILKLSCQDKDLLLSLYENLKILADFKFKIDNEEWRPYVKKYKKQWTYKDGQVIRVNQDISDDDEDYNYSKTPAQDYMKALRDEEDNKFEQDKFKIGDGGLHFKAKAENTEGIIKESKTPKQLEKDAKKEEKLKKELEKNSEMYKDLH